MNVIKNFFIVIGVYIAGHVAVILGIIILGPNGSSFAYALIGMGAVFFLGRHGLAEKLPRHRPIAIGMILAGVMSLIGWGAVLPV
jgi:hypothetical protein